MKFALNAFRCQSSLRLSITHRDIYFIDAVQGDLFVIIIIIILGGSKFQCNTETILSKYTQSISEKDGTKPNGQSEVTIDHIIQWPLFLYINSLKTAILQIKF